MCLLTQFFQYLYWRFYHLQLNRLPWLLINIINIQSNIFLSFIYFIQTILYLILKKQMNRSADFLLGGAAKGKKQAKKPVPTAWRERIPVQDYQGLRDTFLLFDEDGSGKIDPQEIVKVFQQLDLNGRNPLIGSIIWALRQRNKPLDFQQFVDCVCSKVGQYRTKDGLKRIFGIYDKKQQGYIGFEQLKQISRSIGQNLNDDAILQLMHSTFIKNQTESNQRFSFDEFYQIISNYYSRTQK